MNGPDETRNEPSKAYLGLHLDPGRRTVRRAGHREVVQLHRNRLLWGLLETLLAHRDRFARLETLREVWDCYGRTDRPVAHHVYSALSELRERLRCLGVGIENAGETGWRLIDLVKPGAADGDGDPRLPHGPPHPRHREIAEFFHHFAEPGGGADRSPIAGREDLRYNSQFLPAPDLVITATARHSGMGFFAPGEAEPPAPRSTDPETNP